MVIPAAVRAAIAEHARAELPNEACGLLLLDGDVAVEYVAGENASPSPYYFELRLDPVAWADLGDRDLEQAVVHSHVSSEPRPSAPTSSGSASGATALRDLLGTAGRARGLADRAGNRRAHSPRVRIALTGAVSTGRGRCLAEARHRPETCSFGRTGYLTVNEPFIALSCGSQKNL